MISILLKGITEKPMRGSENRTCLQGIHDLSRDVGRVADYPLISTCDTTLSPCLIPRPDLLREMTSTLLNIISGAEYVGYQPLASWAHNDNVKEHAALASILFNFAKTKNQFQITHPIFTLRNYKEMDTNYSPHATHSTNIKFSINALPAKTYISWPSSPISLQHSLPNRAALSFSYEKTLNRKGLQIQHSIKRPSYVSKTSVCIARLCSWEKRKNEKL